MGDPFLRAFVALQTRVLDERGQTASEYMGILLVVAVIIAAVVKSGVAGSISDRIGELVDQIGGSG
jgi:pilus assembly protein Flp/PilA